MKTLILDVKNTTQAKLIIKPGVAIVKVPSHLTKQLKTELVEKFIKVAKLHQTTKQYLKLYYKIGTPYLFLNKKVTGGRKETVATYTFNDL